MSKYEADLAVSWFVIIPGMYKKVFL